MGSKEEGSLPAQKRARGPQRRGLGLGKKMGGGGKAGGRSKGFPFRVSLRELGLLQGDANAVAMKLRAWKGRGARGRRCNLPASCGPFAETGTCHPARSLRGTPPSRPGLRPACPAHLALKWGRCGSWGQRETRRARVQPSLHSVPIPRVASNFGVCGLGVGLRPRC